MNKKTGWMLLAITFLPFLFGTMYFQYVSQTGGQSTVNYGEIISPMREIEALPSKGFWTLVVVAEQCNQSCKDRLLSAETTRILTNENMRRVHTLLISTEALQEEHKPKNFASKIMVPYLPSATKEQWKKITSPFELSKDLLLESILLVDPLGNFMMRYPKGKQDPKLMLKDMERLLKYSRIG